MPRDDEIAGVGLDDQHGKTTVASEGEGRSDWKQFSAWCIDKVWYVVKALCPAWIYFPSIAAKVYHNLLNTCHDIKSLFCIIYETISSIRGEVIDAEVKKRPMMIRESIHDKVMDTANTRDS